MNRRALLRGGACALAFAAIPKAFGDSPFFRGQIPDGPFLPFWESLKAYRCPDWFRDAKFGIWAHWSPQCVPEQGDWYARNMYIQGQPQYEYHVKTYGHPSQFGYKDICHLWKAEKWEPEVLVNLYKRAGAEYLVALATHHDNFDCWNSKHQPWNWRAQYPDFGCNFEVFTDPDSLELETLGPLRNLEPGDTAEHTERWWLFKDIGAGEDESWIDSVILPIVNAL